MSLALIAIPAWEEGAASWIDSVRRAHDPQHGLVPAHVTLVFPTETVSEATIAAAAAILAASFAPFDIACDRLSWFSDLRGGKYPNLVFLHPDAGSTWTLREMRVQLPQEGDFDPHVTLSRFGAVYSAKAFLRQFGEDVTPPARGHIDALHLLRLQNGQVQMLRQFTLTGDTV